MILYDDSRVCMVPEVSLVLGAGQPLMQALTVGDPESAVQRKKAAWAISSYELLHIRTYTHVPMYR